MMEVVKVDERGRMVIPKDIRERIGVEGGGYVRVESEDNRVIIRPHEPVAEEYYGVFKIEEWPEDLDDYMSEALRNWWRNRRT